MRKPRLSAFFIFVFVGPAFSDGDASSIVCKYSRLDDLSWVEVHLDSADVVLLGTVISAEFSEPAEPGKPMQETENEEMPAASMAELLRLIEEGRRDRKSERFDQSVSFEVVKVWKGPPIKELTAKNRVVPGQYGTALKESTTYLVFGYKGDDQIYRISTVCGSTQIVKNVQERIEILNVLTEENKPPNNALH